MAGLLDPVSEAVKILFIGDSGHRKTGAKAALIAAGFKLRMIDTDNGFKILRSLLTDAEHYPYANYMKKHGIDPTEPGRISYIPIEVPIDIKSVSVKQAKGTISYEILSPISAAAWQTVAKQLKNWIDNGTDYGSINDWESDIILDFDTISTLAELAKYWVQDMNNRLGALEDDHGRDSGDAQELIRRLSMQVTSPGVKCNVIWTTHIIRVDVDRGAALSPGQLIRDNKVADARGFPSAIGRSLSPVLGKRWNDLFIAGRTGSGAYADYRIYSMSHDNTDAKHSAWVEDSYPSESGLAQIFSALRYNKTLPNGDDIENFVREIAPRAVDQTTNGGGTATGFGKAGTKGGFGART